VFSVQNAVRVSLHPAIAPDPRGPIHLDVLGQRPEPPLQHIDTLLRRVRAEQGRNARKPSANVEVIYSRTRAADERALRAAIRIIITVVVVAECDRERLEHKDFDGVPEGGGCGEELALGVFCCLAVEQLVEIGDGRDFLVVECFVHLPLWGLTERLQSDKPWWSKDSLCVLTYIYVGVAAASDVRVVVKTFAKPPETFASSSLFR
jgi:hypothetical protein